MGVSNLDSTVINLANTALAAICTLSLAAGSSLAAETVPVLEPSRAQLLYENHCISCHESTIHVRARRAQDRKLLEGWVRKWHDVLSLEWSEQDLLDVTNYLARTFYDFPD